MLVCTDGGSVARGICFWLAFKGSVVRWCRVVSRGCLVGHPVGVGVHLVWGVLGVRGWGWCRWRVALCLVGVMMHLVGVELGVRGGGLCWWGMFWHLVGVVFWLVGVGLEDGFWLELGEKIGSGVSVEVAVGLVSEVGGWVSAGIWSGGWGGRGNVDLVSAQVRRGWRLVGFVWYWWLVMG